MEYWENSRLKENCIIKTVAKCLLINIIAMPSKHYLVKVSSLYQSNFYLVMRLIGRVKGKRFSSRKPKKLSKSSITLLIFTM
ncbi:TPA: hypothetical protein JI313_06240 [Acinetobacter baumannii]|nr:hypothetical protein [Acinetobacter baumannii]